MSEFKFENINSVGIRKWVYNIKNQVFLYGPPRKRPFCIFVPPQKAGY